MPRHALPQLGRSPLVGLVGLAGLCALSGCAGELTVLAALVFGTTLGAWMIGAGRQRRALYEAESLRRAIGTGEHRALEDRLRRELALAEAGEAVSPERQWLARAQLGGLMVAEWRLDEAREIYGTTEDVAKLAPHLQALASFGRHELSVLTETPDDERLEAIRRDRDLCLQHVPAVFRRDVELAWSSVEGLCLVRMGRAREAVDLLASGLKALEYNPALVVYLFHLGQAYEHIGERKLAATRYEEAAKAFPGTRLASEAQFRLRALQPGSGDGSLFRAMLPEAPSAAPTTALARIGSDDDGDEPQDR
jgi:tetratricopeptide (TPR) repeat protein